MSVGNLKFLYIISLCSQTRKPQKGKIIGVLSERWPLAAKEIYNDLRRSESITYQAVHKALKEMDSEGVLSKANNLFRLNPFYLNQMKNSLAELEERIEDTAPAEEGSKVYFCSSFKDWGNKALQLLHSSTDFSTKDRWYIFQDFTVSLLTMSVEEYAWFADLCAKGGYTGYRGDSARARLINGLWEKSGFLTKCIKKFDYPYTYLAQGDFVLQCFFPPELKRKFQGIYRKTKSVEEINTQEYYRPIMVRRRYR